MTLCKACMQQSTLYPLNAQLREKLAYSVSHTPDAPDLAFDKVSFKVGIDTCASATMSHNKDLFEDLILEDLGGCQGVGGALAIAGTGTLTIKMDNSNCRTHLIQTSR